MTKQEFLAEIRGVVATYRPQVPLSREYWKRFAEHDPVLIEKAEHVHSALDGLCDYIENRLEKTT